MVINCNNSSYKLKKKYNVLAYHFCYENHVEKVIDICKIKSENNYLDRLMKVFTIYGVQQFLLPIDNKLKL